MSLYVCGCGRIWTTGPGPDPAPKCPVEDADAAHHVIELMPVTSSHVAAAGWDKNILRVMFKTGVVGDYANVPESYHKGFLAAASKGTFLTALKRDPNRYPWRSIARLNRPAESTT